MLDRRQWLMGAGAAAGLAGLPTIAFASAETDRRLVVIMLRGAMDGLSAAPPYGDPDYQSARTGLAIPAPGQAGGVLALGSDFGLNPALPKLHARHAAGELIVFQAIASPYRDRSHFDGQNLLENGSTQPYGLTDGWLNRALTGLPGPATAGRKELRLYSQTDPKLLEALAGAAQANQAATGMGGAAGGDAFVTLMTAAAKFLSAPDGPCVAMVESTGWDTHAGQTGPYNVLSRNLAELDRGIEALAVGMGPMWSKTAVLAMTEFGRTVAMNGTAGSDHGTASAAFLLGGAVAGGRVIADWPGLKAANLYAGRDLKPTADLRQVMKAALRDHMAVDPGHIDTVVFPQSADAKPFDGLFLQT